MQVRRPTTPGVPRVHAHLPSRRVRSAAEGSQQAVAKPAAAEVAQRPALTFHVVRSVTGELPVYSKISNGRTRRSTVLRKYTGDVEALRQARPRVRTARHSHTRAIRTLVLRVCKCRAVLTLTQP